MVINTKKDFVKSEKLFFSLGCGIGYGYLHRIPTKPKNPDPSPPASSTATDAKVSPDSSQPLLTVS